MHRTLRPRSEGKEHIQVCAGVSALLLTLYALSDEGEWTGDGSGHIKVCVRALRLDLCRLEFVMSGIRLIADNYPGHIEVQSHEHASTSG